MYRRYKINRSEVFGLLYSAAWRFYRLTKALNLPRVEHLYVFFSPTITFLWVAKIGISQGAEIRVKEVEDSISAKLNRKVKLRRVCVPILFAWHIEQAIHRILENRRVPFYRRCKEMAGTSGHTEWFYYLNPVFASIVFGLWWWQGIGSIGWATIVALCLPIPIDFFIFVLIILMAQLAAIGGLIVLLWRAII